MEQSPRARTVPVSILLYCGAGSYNPPGAFIAKTLFPSNIGSNPQVHYVDSAPRPPWGEEPPFRGLIRGSSRAHRVAEAGRKMRECQSSGNDAPWFLWRQTSRAPRRHAPWRRAGTKSSFPGDPRGRRRPPPYGPCQFPAPLDSLCRGADNPKVVARVSTTSRLRLTDADDLLASVQDPSDLKVCRTTDQHDHNSWCARLQPMTCVPKDRMPARVRHSPALRLPGGRR